MHEEFINDNNSSNVVVQSGITVSAISLGCSKNRIDTEEILGFLSKNGLILTDDYKNADIVIVNTCGFIDKAKQESVNALIRIASETRNKKTKIIAAGCLVEIYGSNIVKIIPEISGAIGVHSYRNLISFLREILSGKRIVIKSKPAARYHALSPRILTTPAHSAYVKIAEGCSNCCHYCLIPKIRGHYRSRFPDEIIAEIKYLVENGTREIVLIAQDTTAYGCDNHNLPSLAGLIENILDLKNSFWLRLLYTYPSRIEEKLLDLIKADSRFCCYLDIPLQHVNDEILSQMSRSYRKDELTALINKIRSRFTDMALRTTFMVGYPGETRSQFDELLLFIEQYPFENLGAFAYSAQQGTLAENLKNHVPQRIINKRHQQIMEKQQLVAQRSKLDMIGKRLVILVDKVLNSRNNWYYGRSQYQAPEIDGGIYFRSHFTMKQGDWVSAEICAASPYNYLAKNVYLLDELPG